MKNYETTLLIKALDALPPIGTLNEKGTAYIGSKSAEIVNGKAIARIDVWYRV